MAHVCKREVRRQVIEFSNLVVVDAKRLEVWEIVEIEGTQTVV
jgi:hypothetical protein